MEKLSYYFLSNNTDLSGEKSMNVETSEVALMAERSKKANVLNMFFESVFGK